MNKKPICYLVGAGEYHGMSFFPVPDDFIVAVDDGLTYLKKYCATPDLIVGDFDSLPEPPNPDEHTVALPREKDDTDMAAAVREGWVRGFRVFHIFGGTGGRLDHTLANIQLLSDIAVKGGCGFLFDKDTVITAIHNATITFSAMAQGVVSVFSHTDTSTGVYERGLKYSLTNAMLHSTQPLGISNEFTGAPSSISVESGTLIIIYPNTVQEECS